MIEHNVSKEKLLHYVETEEVVYQIVDELINVSNDENKEYKESLLAELAAANIVDVYEKDDSEIKEEFPDLNDWSTEDDALFFLVDLGVLICISKKDALFHHLITA